MMEKLKGAHFYISIMSWIEALAGSFHHNKTMKNLSMDLEWFVRLPVSEPTAHQTAAIMQENIKRGSKRKFQDSLIAATAIIHGCILVTKNAKHYPFKNLPVERIL